MPAPLPMPLREIILSRAQLGQDVATIARALRLRPRSVRHLLQRCRQQPGAVRPSYRAGPGRPAAAGDLCELAVALRQQHPRWGAGYIRVRLALAHPGRPVPCERTLQRWLRRRQQPAAPPGCRPAAEATRALRPHHTWQVDAVEQLRLGSGQGVSWLRLVDECSGAFLATTVFPPVPLGVRGGVGRPAGVARRLRPLGATPASARGQR